jgi:glycosyltransferase involved in cell wall biosynthesis
LRELLPQCSDSEVEILIVDNASDDNVEQHISLAMPEAKEQVRFIRNRVNVGLASNICRCYEYSNGDWTWTLGDDDAIDPDAVTKILSRIKSLDISELIIGMYFSTTIYQYKNTIKLDSLEDYWIQLKNEMAFSNALFISSNVFNTKVFKNNMNIIMNLISSYAPHIASVSYEISKNGVLYCFPDHIVNWKSANTSDRWNWPPIAAGLPLLCETPGCQDVISKYVKNGVSYHIPKPFRNTCLKILFTDQGKTLQYWSVYFAKIHQFLKLKMYLQVIVLRLVIFIFKSFPYSHATIIIIFTPKKNYTKFFNESNRL